MRRSMVKTCGFLIFIIVFIAVFIVVFIPTPFLRSPYIYTVITRLTAFYLETVLSLLFAFISAFSLAFYIRLSSYFTCALRLLYIRALADLIIACAIALLFERFCLAHARGL